MRGISRTIQVIPFLLSNVLLAGTVNEQKVDLEHLIEAAIQISPTLELAQNALEAGRISETSLPWWEAPEIRLGYGRDTNVSDKYKSDTHPNHQYDTSLRLFPKNPWEREATRNRLKAGNRLQELFNKETQLEISYGITELYWKASYSQAELRLKHDVQAMYQEQVEGMDTLLNEGQITVGVSLPAKMKLLDINIEAERLQREYEAVIGQLGNLCNITPANIHITEPISLNNESFDLPYQKWQSIAMSRTDVTRHELLIEHTKAELSEMEASEKPWFKHVQLGYEAENDYGDKDGASIQIAFQLPFLVSDGGEKLIATKRMQTQRKQEILNRQIIGLEVQSLINEFQSLQRQWQTQDSLIGAMSDELSSAVDKMKAQGNHANRNYWDARITLLQLELKQLQLSESYQELQIKAMRTLGKDSLN